MATNHEAEASLQAVLRRRDPLLLRRLDFDTEAGGVGIVSSSHEDIRAAAAWLASMFKSALNGDRLSSSPKLWRPAERNRL